MKKENTVLYVLRISLTLLIITAVVAALLSVVNGVTAPIIAQLNAEKTQKAIETVLPGGYNEELREYNDQNGAVTAVYKGDNGYAVNVEVAGFGGIITMMVGVDHAGNVLGISIISHAETPSLGAIAAENSSKGIAFREQFVGKGGELAVVKDGGQIDAITSATITSRAVTSGVNIALACVADLG